MAEMIGGDIGTQILNAVQGLGVRMDRLETQMTDLDSRMARQEKVTERLGAELEGLRTEFRTSHDGLRGEFQTLRGDVQRLGGAVQMLRGDVQRLDGEVRTLRGDVQNLRGDCRQLLADMQEGFRRLNARNELTAGTVVLMASVLRRPTELGEDLEKRLRELQTH